MLIVAFDGMDRELVEEYECENLLGLQEFGGFDNSTGMSSIMTSELFASFITGKTYEKHGVKGLTKYERNSCLEFFERNYGDKWPFVNFKGLREAVFKSLNSVEYRERAYKRSDFETVSTIFDEVDAGKALFVPCVNPELDFCIGSPMKALENIFTREDVRRRAWELAERRMDKFWNLNFEFWDLVMLHIHEPDHVYHLEFGDYRKGYEKLDEFAGEVLESFPDSKVVFMSDHGLPGYSVDEDLAHNRNCFYAANFDLFPDGEPHITDFKDRLVELTTS